MACTYNAPNGETSKLFDKVFQIQGKASAVKVWTGIQSQEFKEWYGGGTMDVNGEPALNEFNQFENVTGETLSLSEITHITLNTPTLEEFASQIEKLTDVFEKQGLNIEVTLDEESDNIGSVVTVNGVTKYKFNPRKVKKDSVFHEFGHTYIDMLGIDHHVIQRGIEHLRNSELWRKVARNYPELSGDRLAKEVLTTAVGIEAARFHDERVRLRRERKKSLLGKVKNWKYWVNHFFKTIADKLGLNKTAARQLGFDLTSGNLRYTLTKKPASYIQKMKTKPTPEMLSAESKRLSLTTDQSHYMIDEDENRLVARATTAINTIKGEFDRAAAIRNVLASKKKEYEHFKTEEEVGLQWADKREEGTSLHLMNELYIERRGADGTKGTHEEGIKHALDNLYKPPEGLDENDLRYYSGPKREYVETYIDNIANYLNELYEKGYKLYPEIKVFDEEMGVGGTIDLLIEKPNGEWMIYDFKTKEVGKFGKFYTTDQYQDFNGIMSDLTRNKANEYALQLSTYALILQRKGYNITKLAIIPFEGQIVKDLDESRYIGVQLFSDVNTRMDPDGVLEIDDLTERMKDVYLNKNDIEQALETVDIVDQGIEELLEQATALNAQREIHREWIDKLIVDIRKSVSRIKATADVTTATRYENEMKKLVNQLMVEDEMRALVAYSEYVTKGLSGLYAKFFDKFPATTNEDGSISRGYVEGYDNYTWRDISELEKKDPKKYMEFLAFLINADMFLSQIVNIKNLPFTNSTSSNVVLKALKANEHKVSDLKLKLNRLNKELDLRYAELSSNPLYGGRGVLENTKAFMKAQADENFGQRHFDALADTHNQFLANVMRMHDYKKRYMENEILKITNEWNAKIKQLEKDGISIDRFIDKKTGKVIAKTDYERFYKDRSALYDRLDKFYKGERSHAWFNGLNTWMNENTVLLEKDERVALIKKMKAELGTTPSSVTGTSGFQDWLARQTYDNGKRYKRSSPFYKPNPDVYSNDRYKTYSAKEIEFHDYLTSTLAGLVSHVKGSIVSEGYLPGVPLEMRGALEQAKAKLGWREKGDYNADKGVITNELHEIVMFLPFSYNNMLGEKKPFETYDENSSPEEKARVVAVNKKIKAERAANHAAAVNQDLAKTMNVFIREAITHKHKKAMEFEMLRVRKSFIDNHKILLTKKGKPVVDKFADMHGLENNKVEKTTVGSKSLEHYEKWLKMVFYGQFEKDEGTWQKVARVIQNYTSYKGMALNPLSAINNQVYGTIMSKIEAGASVYFSKADWKEANKEYFKGMVSFYNDDATKGEFTTKQSAFVNYFDIMMDFKEMALGNEDVNLANRALQKVSNVASKAYMLEHASEHNLQNRTLLAMAHSHRLVDGQLVSFYDYKRGKMKKITFGKKDGMTKAEAKKAIAENKALEKTIKEKFEKHKKLYDLVTFKDGVMTFDESLSTEEIAEFQRRVLGVNQYLHGIYNKEDAGAMQEVALGRLAIQFRKWMRPGWNKRFGNRFGEEYWNERRSVKEQGIYVATAKFFAAPARDLYAEYKDMKGTSEAMGAATFLARLVGDYAQFVVNVKVHYHTLNDMEKAGVKRTMKEYATFCIAVGLAYAAASIKGDDDDPPLPLMLLIHQLDRTVTEMTTYVPIAVAPNFIGGGWFNETKKLIKSPMATFGTLEQIIKLGKNIVAYPFADEEETIYGGGVYYGQSKISIQAQKMTPVWNNTFLKFEYLSRNHKYYKLF